MYEEAQHCDGFRYGSADGMCQLLTNPYHYLATAPVEPGDAGSYLRDGSFISGSCPPDWIAFDGSCYAHVDVTDTRDAGNNICRDLNPLSMVVSVNDQLEMTFLLHHSSRPTTGEWLGAIQDSTGWVNPDGTAFGSSITKTAGEGGGNCLNLRAELGKTDIVHRSCDYDIHPLCESGLPKGPPSGCPAGWLTTPSLCFLYVHEGRNWADADNRCGHLAEGGRLGYPGETGMDNILAAYVKRIYAGALHFWIGVHDNTPDRSWQSLDGGPWHFTWDNGRGGRNDERCVCMHNSHGKGYDDDCNRGRVFICQVARANATDYVIGN